MKTAERIVAKNFTTTTKNLQIITINTYKDVQRDTEPQNSIVYINDGVYIF